MMRTFSDWIKSRNEAYGGTAGDPSNSGLNQPEDGSRRISTWPYQAIDKSDLPITKKNKSTYAKKKCERK